jgi:hypothetical protein
VCVGWGGSGVVVVTEVVAVVVRRSRKQEENWTPKSRVACGWSGIGPWNIFPHNELFNLSNPPLYR